jgi:hypothetical protein
MIKMCPVVFPVHKGKVGFFLGRVRVFTHLPDFNKEKTQWVV